MLGNFSSQIGPLPTGIGYLKRYLGFPPAKAHTFSKRVRKVVDRVGRRSKGKRSEEKCTEVQGGPNVR
jgi:hypothetical protein